MITPKGRTRKSKSTSCNWCRRRKIKCDRSFPCSSCVRFQQTCEYENVPLEDETLTDDELGIQKQLEFVKLKLKYLEQSLSASTSNSSNSGLFGSKFVASKSYNMSQPLDLSRASATSNDTDITLDNWKKILNAKENMYEDNESDAELCIYDQYDSVSDDGPLRKFYGPFTWAAFLLGDMFVTGINKLWREMVFKDKDHLLTSESAMEEYFLKRFQWISGEEAFVTVKDEVSKAIKDKKSKINRTHKNVGLIFHDSDIDNDLELVNKIKLVLPNQKTIWLLVDRYFGLLYPMLPFLDESSFRSVIIRLMKGRRLDEEKVSWLNVVTKLDFAYLGMLLIILRLSFLSLFTNFNEINETMIELEPDETVRYLMNNTVSFECIILAELCLNQFNLMKSVNITLIQLALFYKAYYFYGPEFCDPLDDNSGSAINTILMDMAYTAGLHRDPINFANFNEREANLARKLWFHICCYDFMSSIALGDPSHLSKYFSDVREPDVLTERDNFNNHDMTMNRLADVLLFRNAEVFQMMNFFHNKVLNVNGKFKIEQMNKICDGVKDILIAKDPAYEVFVRELDPKMSGFYTKTFELKALFELISSYMAINYHFFTFLTKEGKYEKAMRYLIKIFSYVFDITFPLLIDIFSGKKRELQGLFEMIINPSIQVLITRTRHMMVTLLVRVKIFKSKFPELLGCLGELERNVLDINRIYRNINLLLSKKYYYSWKTFNFSNAISKLVDLVDINELCADHDLSHPYGFTEDNVSKINKILGTALAKAKDSALVNNLDDSCQNDNDELWTMVRSLTKKNREETSDIFEFSLQLSLVDVEDL